MNKQLRRTLIKSMGIGSVWSTPVVSSILLPVHAKTSNVSPVDELFDSAGTTQFTVPDGITQLKITVNGAGGGTANGILTTKSNRGGNGEQVQQTVTTVPGDTLNITVGGGGQDAFSSKKTIQLGNGGTPGDGQDPNFWGGGGGGFSQVTGSGINIQAGGGGGGSGPNKTTKMPVTAKGGDGGGSNGGTGGTFISDGANSGNGLGGSGSTTAITDNLPPLKGADGSVLISSS